MAKEKREYMVSIMLTGDEHTALQEAAEKDNRSISSFGQLLIREALEKLGFLKKGGK